MNKSCTLFPKKIITRRNSIPALNMELT